MNPQLGAPKTQSCDGKSYLTEAAMHGNSLSLDAREPPPVRTNLLGKTYIQAEQRTVESRLTCVGPEGTSPRPSLLTSPQARKVSER